MPSTRKLLLDAIASLDAAAPPDVCADALDAIFTSCSSSEAFDDESCDGGVTPLMIACDKSITSALEYVRQQIQNQATKEVSVWGRVTDKSSESGNCALHHALAANFQTGLDVLEYYAFNAKPLSPDQNNLQRYMALLEQPNVNGDTPIMMACVYGHSGILRHILKRSYHLASTANSNPDTETIVKNTWQSLHELFEKRNKEGCSALNLACGHGHVDIVRLLIHGHSVSDTMELNLSSTDDTSEIEASKGDAVHKLMPLVTVTYKDVLRCQSTIDNLEVSLKMMKQKNVAMTKQEEFHQQHKKVLDCLGILNAELGRIAAETASSLLTQDEGSQDQSHSAKKPKVKPSTKKKKKKKQVAKPKQQENPDIDSSTTENTTQSERPRDGWRVDTKSNVPSTSTSPFITLQDGRVISKSQTPEDVPCEDDSADKLMHVSPAPKTLESILQSNSRYCDSAATTMESLCLDPSMLLLSAHGMAMEMSPCQLDAIESILTNQLRASKEAQKIQSRLLNNN
eukprot:scaffold6564_cov179-Skeletonema_marinoi.AAC.4